MIPIRSTAWSQGDGFIGDLLSDQMANLIALTRHPWNGQDYLEAKAGGVTACCYVPPGTAAFAAVEEDGIVVIRAEDEGQTLLAEAHPKREP